MSASGGKADITMQQLRDLTEQVLLFSATDGLLS